MSANFLSSSHLTYIFSTYFLSSWTGVLSFKRPLNIDYGRINIICLVYFITNELIRPYSVNPIFLSILQKNKFIFQCLTILATHFVMFVHIIEMELFRRQKEFLMTYGLLNFGNQYADDSFICASRYLRITVHAEFWSSSPPKKKFFWIPFSQISRYTSQSDCSRAISSSPPHHFQLTSSRSNRVRKYSELCAQKYFGEVSQHVGARC